MARPSKPTELIVLEGRGHRTKAELEHRKKAEKSLYTGQTFRASEEVRQNEVAHREFKRLKSLYSKIQYVDGLDEQIINRYCLELANLNNINERIEKLDNELDTVDDSKERIKIYELMARLDSATLKSKELLLKYEDRLFLNPTSRMKAIPKTPPKEEKKEGMSAFLAKKGLM